MNWSPAIPTSKLHANVNQLMNRELNDHDYEFLLSLGDGEESSIVYLLKAVKSMPAEERNETSLSNGVSTCAICSVKVNKAMLSLKYLRCSENHVAHESCVLELLIQAQADARLGAAGAQCPLCRESGWLFPSLVDENLSKAKHRDGTKEKPRKLKIHSEDIDIGVLQTALGMNALSINGHAIQTNANHPNHQSCDGGRVKRRIQSLNRASRR